MFSAITLKSSGRRRFEYGRTSEQNVTSVSVRARFSAVYSNGPRENNNT